MSDKILYTHILKTGGTSLLNAHRDDVGDQNVWQFSQLEDKLLPIRGTLNTVRNPGAIKLDDFMHRHTPTARRLGAKAVNSVRRHLLPPSDSAFDEATVITGHFPASRFVEQAERNGFRMQTVVREPLDRMWSHYKYWQHRGSPADIPLASGLSPDLTFEGFALHPEMANYQLKALDIDVSRFKLIGVTEYLDAYLEESGIRIDGGAPHDNKTRVNSSINVSSDFMMQFETLHADDYQLYETVRSDWA